VVSSLHNPKRMINHLSSSVNQN